MRLREGESGIRLNYFVCIKSMIEGYRSAVTARCMAAHVNRNPDTSPALNLIHGCIEKFSLATPEPLTSKDAPRRLHFA